MVRRGYLIKGKDIGGEPTVTLGPRGQTQMDSDYAEWEAEKAEKRKGHLTSRTAKCPECEEFLSIDPKQGGEGVYCPSGCPIAWVVDDEGTIIT